MEINTGDKFIFHSDEEVTPMEGLEVTVTDMDMLASISIGEPMYVIVFDRVEFEGQEYEDSLALESELTPVEAPALV